MRSKERRHTSQKKNGMIGTITTTRGQPTQNTKEKGQVLAVSDIM